MAWFEELTGRPPRGEGGYTPLSALAPLGDDVGYSDLAEEARAVAARRVRQAQCPEGGRKSMPSLADIRAAEAAYLRELSGEPDPDANKPLPAAPRVEYVPLVELGADDADAAQIARAQAAGSMRRAAQPMWGRKESAPGEWGARTQRGLAAIGAKAADMADDVLHVPERAIKANEHYMRTGEYDPAPFVDSALFATGGTAFSAPRGSLGAGPGRRLLIDEASRMARARKMDFHTDMPVHFAEVPSGERIASAAIDVNGRVFTAPSHAEAILKAESELGIPANEMTLGPIWDGFITNSGRYVSRREAADIAARSGQGEARGSWGTLKGLASEDTTMSSARPKADYHIGATAPGLPGGDGVWGYYYRSPEAASPSPAAPSTRGRAQPSATDAPGEYTSARTAALWHRAENPVAMDAARRQDHEIRATLMNAWDQGHDAVLIRNYSTPGGEIRDVIVVKDPAQLRSPSARFDPRKKNSADLLAGAAGMGVIGYGPFSDLLPER